MSITVRARSGSKILSQPLCSGHLGEWRKITFGYRSRGDIMIRLAEKNIRASQRRSSKGNQLKWEDKGFWYKADYMGYEGLAEYVVSSLLKYSDLAENMYIRYQTEEIFYKRNHYLGRKSRDFLPKGWQRITLDRLFQSNYGRSLYKSIL